MFNLNGKYGEATVYTDNVDEATISQVISVLNTPLAKNSSIKIMPDCHAGTGCVIGTTMTITDKVCPNLVGVDIGCGMTVTKLGKLNLSNKEFEIIDDICHHKIPSGFAVHSEMKASNWLKYRWSFQIENKLEPWNDFLNKLKCYDKLNNVDRLIRSLGSLGGGNHFIEINKDSNNNYYLVIHSGSRNLGKQVAEIYQRLAINVMHDYSNSIKIMVEMLKEQGRHSEIQESIEKFKAKQPKFTDELAYLEGDHLSDYLNDLYLCQEFASHSRNIMSDIIIEELVKQKILDNNNKERFETIHNYINPKDSILRKGAVSANLDEVLLIPINMRDGSLLCRGLGNSNWNYSAPHGAGRIMSRSEAKENIDINDYIASMDGIYSTTVNYNTIDESPMAYKPIESILENIKETVEIIDIIKPVYNFKAGE